VRGSLGDAIVFSKRGGRYHSRMDEIFVDTLASLGLTLPEYAAARRTHPQAARIAYRNLMRHAANLTLPAATRQQITDDDTIKFCLPVPRELPPNSAMENSPQAAGPQTGGSTLETESVIVPMKNFAGRTWRTLCLSSQVGCRMGCTFCQTGRMGLIRNLTAAEIVQQRLVARQLLRARDPSLCLPHVPGTPPQEPAYFADGIQNIVFMGMGEPLDNFENVVQGIRVFADPNGLAFPHAQITVSTVGRIDGIRKLAALHWPNLRLAISLNAATDKLRDELMPINRGMPLAELQRALLEYPLARKGRLLIEYVLIKDVNDSLADADAVAAWCRPLPCIVNLIPYNPQQEAAYETPEEERIGAFLFRLKNQGIFVKRRVTHGRDLMGACGQLGNPELRRGRLKVLA
jgi:23S rRNA (adenine2503-C2)-methyltransferase